MTFKDGDLAMVTATREGHPPVLARFSTETDHPGGCWIFFSNEPLGAGRPARQVTVVSRVQLVDIPDGCNCTGLSHRQSCPEWVMPY